MRNPPIFYTLLFINDFFDTGGIAGIGIHIEDDNPDKRSVSWSYGKSAHSYEEFYERYEYLTKALVDSPYVCGFCYTQLYDVEQEVNGIYTYERKAKFDMDRIKKITQYEKKDK